MRSLEQTLLAEKTLILAALVSGVIAVTAFSAAETAFATPSPTGSPGQPGAPGTTCGMPDATVTPGNSASANGSPFNPDGTSGTVYAGNPGTASLAHANSPLAVSQYDVACFQQTTSY